jgi:hypothetical protein
MGETSGTGFLIRGTKEKSEDDVFQGHHLHQIPLRTELQIAFPWFIPMHIGEQFVYRFTETLW